MDQMHLLLQIPVVENHAHRDHVRLGKRIVKKIARRRQRDAAPRTRYSWLDVAILSGCHHCEPGTGIALVVMRRAKSRSRPSNTGAGEGT